MQKIVAVGRPLTDSSISKYPEKYASWKNSFRYMDRQEAVHFLSDVSPSFVQGGSAANTSCECSRLGAPVIYVGSVGSDERGLYLSACLGRFGVIPLLKVMTNDITGFTVLVNTPNDRHGFYYYGASDFPDITPVDQDYYGIFYSESYIFSSPKAEDIVNIYRRHRQTTALTLSGTASSAQEQSIFLAREIVMNGWCDVLFGNEKEYLRVFGYEDINECIEKADVKLGAVTLGEKGSIVFSHDERHYLTPYAKVRSGMLGDGDAYAGGFLFGFATGYSLLGCGLFGSKAAYDKISCGLPRE